MKIVILFLSVILCFTTKTLSSEDAKDAVITNYEFERGPTNNYHFGFDSSDGTSRQEEGSDDENNSLAVKGVVSWIAQDGSRYEMYFNADDKGFRPIIKRISGP